MTTRNPFLMRVLDYADRHKLFLAVLTLIGTVGLAIGAFWAPTASVQQGLWFAFGTGVLSSLVIAVTTDFMSKEFFYDVLRNFELSVHKGGLVHATHREIPSRIETIERFFAEGQIAKIITLTADHYINEERVFELLRQRIQKGSKVRILLHTPIYNLRSYVDRRREFTRHGKRHLTALELVRQQSLLIPKIEEIDQSLGDAFQVRFFAVQLHVHCAIWGNRRIYASPILRGVEGADSLCVEVFPGLKDATLFKTFERDFDYIWERPDMTFSVQAIKPLYTDILRKYPMDIDLQAIDPAFVLEIERSAAAMQEAARVPVPAATTAP